MRAIHFALLGWTALGGLAMAQEPGNSAPTTPAPIHFDLAAPKDDDAAESLPAASTLSELTYANQPQATAKPAAKIAARPAPKLAAKALPKPVPRPVRKAVAANEQPAAWMSPWRRAYVAKYGHQPPAPAH
jgi:hypothetical protein